MITPSMNTSSLSKRNFIKTKGLGQDRLSSLPGHLICRILSELPTTDSVRTSALSKGWKDTWLDDVPTLDLNFNYFKDEVDLMDFIDRFLETSNGLDRFKLIYDDFVSKIHDVVGQDVCRLTVVNMVDVDDALVRMPLSLYSCATLVDLTLHFVVFDDPAELVSLPCVKKMYLEGVKFDGINILETLIASCLSLEDLTIITHMDDLEVVCVRSRSLKTFKLESRRHRGADPNVEIDAPKLESMIICGYDSKSFVIHSIGPFAKINLDFEFFVGYDEPPEIIILRNFITGLSKVYEMTISARTLAVILGIYSDHVEKLPQFSNLSRLEASLIQSYWEYLPAFLGCCMNLRSLIVEFNYVPSIEEIELSPLPQCVLSSLEFIQLKTSEARSIMELGAYFTKNCAVFQNCTFEGFQRDNKRYFVMRKSTYKVVSH